MLYSTIILKNVAKNGTVRIVELKATENGLFIESKKNSYTKITEPELWYKLCDKHTTVIDVTAKLIDQLG